jgi:serine phosphatase RsbU (regulator of sigma subunit)
MSAPVNGPAAMASATDRSEGFGERLLGTMIERAHEMPPHLIAPLVAELVAAIGGRDVAVLLPDYDQLTLVSLPGQGLVVEQPEPIEDSAAGRAFLGDALVEQPVQGGVRLLVPMLDGTDRVGVLAFTGDNPSEDDRRLARRFAGLLADVLITKSMYTDRFFQARRRQPMSLSAEMQYALLPPLMMTTAQVAVAGILEPAYQVGGDSFDYALNDDVLHLAIIDAMGHGLDAAVMATVAVAAYRHARRAEADLPGLYAQMDAAIAEQFDADHFVTAQLAQLDVAGRLRWVNAGHPRPLLWRPGQAVRALRSPTTLPAGIGGGTPAVGQERLHRGDRVLFYTHGIIEERLPGGEQFGARRLLEQFTQAEQAGGPVQQTVRRLSHTLLQARGGTTSDDATLFLLQWRGGDTSHLTALDPTGQKQ